MASEIKVAVSGQGLYDITHKVAGVVDRRVDESGVSDGLVGVFVRHTSASLLIQENADPAVQADLAAFFARLVPEGDLLFTHNDEGPDDMPAHVKAALTQTHLSIPLAAGRMLLGTWQGIYLWEHRHAPHERQIVVSLVAGV